MRWIFIRTRKKRKKYNSRLKEEQMEAKRQYWLVANCGRHILLMLRTRDYSTHFASSLCLVRNENRRVWDVSHIQTIVCLCYERKRNSSERSEPERKVNEREIMLIKMKRSTLGWFDGEMATRKIESHCWPFMNIEYRRALWHCWMPVILESNDLIVIQRIFKSMQLIQLENLQTNLCVVCLWNISIVCECERGHKCACMCAVRYARNVNETPKCDDGADRQTVKSG